LSKICQRGVADQEKNAEQAEFSKLCLEFCPNHRLDTLSSVAVGMGRLWPEQTKIARHCLANLEANTVVEAAEGRVTLSLNLRDGVSEIQPLQNK
jgi:hypothetical protein